MNVNASTVVVTSVPRNSLRIDVVRPVFAAVLRLYVVVAALIPIASRCALFPASFVDNPAGLGSVNDCGPVAPRSEPSVGIIDQVGSIGVGVTIVQGRRWIPYVIVVVPRAVIAEGSVFESASYNKCESQCSNHQGTE